MTREDLAEWSDDVRKAIGQPVQTQAVVHQDEVKPLIAEYSTPRAMLSVQEMPENGSWFRGGELMEILEGGTMGHVYTPISDERRRELDREIHDTSFRPIALDPKAARDLLEDCARSKGGIMIPVNTPGGPMFGLVDLHSALLAGTAVEGMPGFTWVAYVPTDPPLGSPAWHKRRQLMEMLGGGMVDGIGFSVRPHRAQPVKVAILEGGRLRRYHGEAEVCDDGISFRINDRPRKDSARSARMSMHPRSLSRVKRQRKEWRR